MWKSVRQHYPEDLDEFGNTNPLFLEWVQEFKTELWFVALRDLVECTGVWTGTQEELMLEIRRRVSSEAWEAEDFPRDFPKFWDYFEAVYDASMVAHNVSVADSDASGSVNLEIFDYREVKKDGELEEFDVPGWGTKAPILVERDYAGRRPSYHSALMCFFVRHEAGPRDPLALAVLRFTYRSGRFTRKKRLWTGSTRELAKWLRKYYPDVDGRNYPPDPVQATDRELFRRYDETKELLELQSPSNYVRFHKRLKACVPVLEEAGVEVGWKKVPSAWTTPEGVRKPTKKTRWGIRAPWWRRAKVRSVLVTP